MDVDATPEGPAPDPREELKEWPEFVSSLDRIVLFDVLDVYLDILDLYRYFLIYCLISVSKRKFFSPVSVFPSGVTFMHDTNKADKHPVVVAASKTWDLPLDLKGM